MQTIEYWAVTQQTAEREFQTIATFTNEEAAVAYALANPGWYNAASTAGKRTLTLFESPEELEVELLRFMQQNGGL